MPMRNLYLTLLLCLTGLTATAQTEERKDSVSLPPDTVQFDIDAFLRDLQQDERKQELDERARIVPPRLDPSTITTGYREPGIIRFNIDRPQVMEKEPSHRNPIGGNFSAGGILPLTRNTALIGSHGYKATPLFGSERHASMDYLWQASPRFALSTGLSGSKYNWGMAGSFNSYNIHTQAQWQVNDRLSVAGGVGATRYDFFRGGQTQYNFSGSLSYQLNDRITLRGFGQYSLNHPTILDQPGTEWSNKTYGGAMEFRITDRFGVGVGAERTFNPWRGKWETHPIFYPVFYDD